MIESAHWFVLTPCAPKVAVSSSLDSFQLCHVLAMEVEEDVDLSLVIISDAFFESKLLSAVFGAWFLGRSLEQLTLHFLQA